MLLKNKRCSTFFAYGLLLVPLIMGCMISLCSRDLYIRSKFSPFHFGQNQVHNIVWGFTCAIFPLGGCIGTFLATFMESKIGKKSTVISMSTFGILSLVAYALSYFMDSYILFVSSRFGQGFVSGGLMNIGLVLMFDLIPCHRHRIVSPIIQPLINLGIVISGIFSLDIITRGNWLITMGPLLLFSLLCLIVCFFLSETHKLKKIKNYSNLNTSGLYDQSAPETLSCDNCPTTESKNISVRSLLKDRQMIGPLIVSMLISIFQQLSGINVVIFYISEFIQAAEFKYIDLGNLIAFAVCFIGSVIFAFIIPHTGTKNMLVLGFAGMSFSFGLAYVLFLVKNIPILTVILLSLFLFWFQSGPGPKPWSVFKETFPPEYQTPAQGILTFSNWVTNFLMAAFFPFALNAIKFHSVGLFAGINLIFAIVLTFLMVETKNKSYFDIIVEYQIKFSRYF